MSPLQMKQCDIVHGGPRGTVRALFVNHSIISLLCLVWVQALHRPRETSQVLLAGVPFSPQPTDWSVLYELK